MKNIFKRIGIIALIGSMAFTMTGCDVTTDKYIMKVINALHGEAKEQIRGEIESKWQSYYETLNNAKVQGFLNETKYNGLKTKADGTKDLFLKTFGSDSPIQGIDEGIFNNICWVQSPIRMTRIYNESAMLYGVAVALGQQDLDKSSLSPNVANYTKDYGEPSQNIKPNTLDLLEQILDKCKGAEDALNDNTTGSNVATGDCVKSGSWTHGSPEAFDSSVFGDKWTNGTKYICYTTLEDKEHKEYDDKGNCILSETDYKRSYYVLEPKKYYPKDEGTIRDALSGTKNIKIIWSDNDIDDCIKEDTKTGFKTLKQSGTNTTSNDIDLNVIKYDLNISASSNIEHLNELLTTYDDGKEDKVKGQNIIDSGYYLQNGFVSTGDVYVTTNYNDKKELLKEKEILKIIATRNGTGGYNELVNRDFVLQIGGVPLCAIRMFEISKNFQQVIGQGEVEEERKGYTLIQTTSQGRVMIPTRVYISYIDEIDKNGNFTIMNSNTSYDLMHNKMEQDDVSYTDEEKKELAKRYDLKKDGSFLCINGNLLCLDYLGYFWEEDVAQHWYPIGRRFRIDGTNLDISNEGYERFNSIDTIGYWFNEQDKPNQNTFNAIKLSDLCDNSSMNGDDVMFVLDSGNAGGERLVGQGGGAKKSNSQNYITVNVDVEEKSDANGIWFVVKTDNGYLTNGTYSWNGEPQVFGNNAKWIDYGEDNNSTIKLGGSINWEGDDNVGWKAKVNGDAWIRDGVYKIYGKIYEIDADGYAIERTNSQLLQASGNVNQKVVDALNETSQFYFDNVYTYQANYRVENNITTDVKAFWTSSGRGELSLAHNAGQNALNKRNKSINDTYNANPSKYTKDTFENHNQSFPILLEGGKYTQAGETFEQTGGVRGAYTNGSSVWGDDCSAFAGAYLETLCKKATGQNLITYVQKTYGSNKMSALDTNYFQFMNLTNGTKDSNSMIVQDLGGRFNFFSGNDLKNLTIRQGDVMCCYDKNTKKISHIEICAGGSLRMGWGKVRNKFQSTTYGKKTVDGMQCITYNDSDSGGERYVIGVIRFNG